MDLFYDAFYLAFLNEVLKKECQYELEQHEGEQIMSKLFYLDGDYLTASTAFLMNHQMHHCQHRLDF